jgi:hypothetical protein
MSYTDTMLDQAEHAISEGRLDDAHAILNPILEAEPHNPRVWAVLADATQDAAEAAGYRTKVVELARAANVAPPSGPMPPYPQQPQQSYQSGPMPFYQPPPAPIYYPPPQAPISPANIIGWLVIGLAVLVIGFCVIGWIAGYAGYARNPTNSTGSQASTVKVTYSVTGSKGRYVNLTYTNASGGTEQVSKRMPWTETFTVKRGEHLYLSAQADSVATSVTCLIIANDQKIEEAKSSGDYVIASCSGLAR